MNRMVRVLAWGVAGAVLTGALIGVAVAVAGNDIATPVRPIGLTSNRPEQPVQEPSEPREGPTHDQGKGDGDEGAQPVEDRGGDATSGSNSGPGSGDSGGADEGSGDSGGDHDGDGGDNDD
jgi:hypothetical protein